MRRQRGLTTRARIGGTVLTAALVFAGCGSEPEASNPAPPTASNTTTPASPAGQENPLGGGGGAGGNEVNHYKTIAEAVNDPENIGILGTATDVRISRVIGEEASAGLLMVGVTVRVDSKISGRTRGKIGSRITVEFIGPTRVPSVPNQIADLIAGYKRDLDQLGQAIWIVANKGGKESAYYVLASSQCLFGEQDGAVVNPGYVNSPAPDPMVTSAENYASLTDLADAMRAADKSR